MDIFLGLCVVIITAAITVLVVYLIQVLIQLKETLQSADILIKKVSTEVESLEETVENVSNISRSISKVGAPVISIVGLMAGFFKGLNFIRGRKKKER